jgi:hypothetical protein
MLSECIDKLSDSGYDLMIVSHLPVPEDIQMNVHVCLYDKENPLLSFSQTPSWEFFSTNFNVIIYTQGHTVAVSRNIMNGVELAEQLGYNFFYYMEADSLLHPDDVRKLESLRMTMFDVDKQMILFNPEKDTYDTLLFGGKPTYFMNSAKLPRSIDELEHFNVSLERLLYYNIHHLKQDFVINKLSVNAYFNKSKINLITHNYLVEVIGVQGSNNLLLWIQNHPSNPNPIYITINDSPEFQLMPDTWSYSYVNSDVMVNIINGDQVETKRFSLSQKCVDEYRKKGTITFK